MAKDVQITMKNGLTDNNVQVNKGCTDNNECVSLRVLPVFITKP